jgi:hypothetical protein
LGAGFDVGKKRGFTHASSTASDNDFFVRKHGIFSLGNPADHGTSGLGTKLSVFRIAVGVRGSRERSTLC